MSVLLTTKYLYKAPFNLDARSLHFDLGMQDHPAKAPFKGCLTRVGEASTRAPAGSAGHRVLIPDDVAQRALPSLAGMPINFSNSLNSHDKKQVVGIIERGYIEGQDLMVEGYLLAKNWPDAIEELRNKKEQLGMSYEIGNVEVINSSSPIWVLSNLVFTGASVLYKRAAAYEDTAFAAHAEEETMEQNVLEKLTAVQAQLDVLAAHDTDDAAALAAEDDAEATAAEAEAAREVTAAARADADQDAEDAAAHRAIAAAKYQAASVKRLRAIKRHETLAAQCTEAGEQEAATQHQADVTRLQAAEAASLEARKVLETTEDVEAAKSDDDEDDDDRKMFGQFQKFKAWRKQEGMTYPATMAKRGRQHAAADHDDEEKDIALFRKMMQDKDQSASSPTDLATRRQLRTLQATVDLLTDSVSKMTGLLTDVVAGRTTLTTDTPDGANGGPVRKTMAAVGEAWVSKDTQTTTPAKDTVQAIHAKATEEGLDPRHSMAKTLEAQWAGKLS